MKIAETLNKILACIFRKPILTGVILSAIPAFVSVAIVGVLVWTLFAYCVCLGIPEPSWAWRPLTHLSWWVCLITGMALIFLILLSFVGVSGFKTKMANLAKAFTISAVVVGASMSMVLLILISGDKIRDRNNYNDWDDLSDDELLVQLVPRSATHIKRRDFGGFKSYQCDVSCNVTLKGLEEFAKERGYNFERAESGSDKALNCTFRRKATNGMSQCFEFVYDIVHEELRCRYSDD